MQSMLTKSFFASCLGRRHPHPFSLLTSRFHSLSSSSSLSSCSFALSASSSSSSSLSSWPQSSSSPSSSSSVSASASGSLFRRNFAVQTSVGAPLRKKVTTIDLQRMRARSQRIVMSTAYTYPSAVAVDLAGIDVLLVGDSLAMVELGHDSTLPVTLDNMIYHCQAVTRGANTPLLVGDMPFGCYESSREEAYKSGCRFLKEGGMDCVKLEGGRERAETVKHLVDGGIAVMGHVGLTPQRISVLGGFRAQGKSLVSAISLVNDAVALERAGAFALIVECVPAAVARAITEAVSIPTIGIGAGPHCSGQVLVFHDLCGFYLHAHHAKVTPQFCKQYARVGEVIQNALNEFRKDVTEGTFPGDQYSPYKLASGDDEQQVTEKLNEYVKQIQADKERDRQRATKILLQNPFATSVENTEAHAPVTPAHRSQDGVSNTNLTTPPTDETIKVY